MTRRPREGWQKCCASFRQAFQVQTDSEGYGRLILDAGNVLLIGCGLGEIHFCPWCGTAVARKEDASKPEEPNVTR